MKKLLIRTVIRTVVIIVIMTVLSNLTHSPIITNEMAMAQMESSAYGFTVWSTYSELHPVVDIVLVLLGAWMIYGVIKDIKKHFEKEN